MGVMKFMNFFHLIGAIIWIGGMIYINFILMPRLKVIDPQERGKLLNAISKPFSIMEWTSIVVLILTGLHKTPAGMMFNMTSTYGTIMFIKHILILIAIFVGLAIAFGALPKMRKLAPKPGEKPLEEFISAQKTLGMLSVTNMVLGIIIVILIKFI